MPNRVRVLTVPGADRVRLEQRARDRGVEARVVERARIVLLAAEGLTGPQIAERVGCGGDQARRPPRCESAQALFDDFAKAPWTVL